MSIVFLLVVLAVLCNSCLSLSFSCEGTGCSVSANADLTQCTCGSEKKFYYKSSWKFNDAVKTLGTVSSSNATHYKLTYVADYEGACISGYQNQDYFKISSPDEKLTPLVNGKQNVLVATLDHVKNAAISVGYYIYHCTLNLEVVAEPLY
ncbi:hypothetical protein EON65_44135 [archaeon]|nr:MAG: hypothetical protein EON65_44135 [archaeon]